MEKHIHGGDVYRYRDYMDFSANLNPLGLAPGVKAALVRASAEVEHYPDVRCEELKAALAAYEQTAGIMGSTRTAAEITDTANTKYGQADGRDDFSDAKVGYFCGNGAAEVIFALCLAVRPKKVLLPAPTFAEYEQAVRMVDGSIAYYNLREEENFIPGEGFLEVVAQTDADLLFFCNPNNPTGVLSDGDYMKKLLDVCSRKDILLAVDECFLDFVEEGEQHSLKPYLKTHPNLFLVKAFTKRYAMAGVRLGYGMSSDLSLIEKMETVVQPWNVSTLAQAAGVAALAEEEYVKTGQQIVFQERNYLMEGLKLLNCKVYPSAANYIFFRSEPGLDEKLKFHRILIRNCSNYAGLAEGYYRIAVRNHEENARLLEAMKKSIEIL